MGVLGGLAARREAHDRVWELLGDRAAEPEWRPLPFYADALPCLARLRGRGLLVGAAGNTPLAAEELLRDHVDIVGSSARWGVAKPAPEFFAAGGGRDRRTRRTRSPTSATASTTTSSPRSPAGLVGVHVRRGPWGHLHDPPPAAIAIRSLAELPEALDG